MANHSDHDSIDGSPGTSSSDLSPSIEDRLRQGLRTGDWVDFRVGDKQKDNPENSAHWGPKRQVSATDIARLLTEPTSHGRSLGIRGAKVVGTLDLEYRTLLYPLRLEGCRLERVILEQSIVVGVWFERCVLESLSADQMQAKFNVGLPSSRCRGGVSFTGARISGQLDLAGARLNNPNGPALRADSMTVEQSMYCNEKFRAVGGVRLVSAHVAGQLRFEGAQLINRNGLALIADSLVVDRILYCTDGFRTKGEFRLIGAHIRGQFHLKGACLDNPGGQALEASAINVDRTMLCDGKFNAKGEVRLRGAHVGGDLKLSEACLDNPNGRALDADSLVVDQTMSCDEKFNAKGEVRLRGAHIGGGLRLSEACLDNPNGRALDADSLVVDRTMFCDGNFNAKGEVQLSRAHIAGHIMMSGASLSKPSGPALSADGLKVDGVMSCREGFTIEGDVRLRGAEIGRFRWEPKGRPSGVLKLAGTRVGYLDDAVGLWPDGLRLDKLTYGMLGGLSEHGSVDARLGWLGVAGKNEGYRPRSYNQLAKTYREAGYDDAARVVLVEKQRARARSVSERHGVAHTDAPSRARRLLQRALRTLQRCVRRVWDWFLTYSIGYGYRPSRIIPWLAGAVLAATLVFAIMHPMYVKPSRNAPSDKEFHPFLYSLDLLLPVANLGQRNSFVTYGPAEWVAAILIVTGWLLGAVLVAGLGGVFKRD